MYVRKAGDAMKKKSYIYCEVDYKDCFVFNCAYGISCGYDNGVVSYNWIYVVWAHIKKIA